jgi:hypothetical protein
MAATLTAQVFENDDTSRMSQSLGKFGQLFGINGVFKILGASFHVINSLSQIYDNIFNASLFLSFF